MANESYPELTSGDKGDWVAYLQRLLEHAGYGPLPLAPGNGYFDAATTAALTSFQVAHGINPPGVANQVTWEALIAIGERPQGEPTPAPDRGQGGLGGEGPVPNITGPLGNLVLFGPSPLMIFSIIGIIGGLAERHEWREKQAAALEALRTTGDEHRRWTLANAAANIIQDFLVSSDADGVLYTTSEAQRIQAGGAALVDLLHENDWIRGASEIGVVEGWLGNIPQDVWNEIGGRVNGLWKEMVEALQSGTPRSNEGPDLVRGAIDVDAEDVKRLFFSPTSHSEYYVKGR